MANPSTGFGFHHVALRAMDFDRTLRFYTEGLGFTVRHEFAVEGRIDRAAFLDAGDGRYLEVFGPASIVQADGRRRRPDEERTVRLGQPPIEARIAFVTGPDGEVIEFVQSEQI